MGSAGSKPEEQQQPGKQLNAVEGAAANVTNAASNAVSNIKTFFQGSPQPQQPGVPPAGGQAKCSTGGARKGKGKGKGKGKAKTVVVGGSSSRKKRGKKTLRLKK